MSYEEWYDKYVKSSPEQLKYEKLERNRVNDLKQFELYKNKFKEYNVPKEFIPKDIDFFTKLKYNIIENKGQQSYKAFKIRYKILNTDWKIHEGKQGKHIKGHNNYKGASYFKEGIDLEKLARENLGRGIIKIDKKNNWTNKEIITVDNIIGYNVEDQTKMEKETNMFSIHYDKKGKIHLVPRRKD